MREANENRPAADFLKAVMHEVNRGFLVVLKLQQGFGSGFELRNADLPRVGVAEGEIVATNLCGVAVPSPLRQSREDDVLDPPVGPRERVVPARVAHRTQRRIGPPKRFARELYRLIVMQQN